MGTTSTSDEKRYRPQLIIFDCDGVVVDSEKITMGVFGDALRELGLDFSLTTLFEAFVGPSVSSCYRRVEDLLGAPLPENFAQQQLERTERALRTLLTPVNGMPTILSQLDYPYCLASNSNRRKIMTCLDTTKLTPYFTDKVFSAVEDVPNAKPAPDIYRYIAKVMKISPEQCLVIEDSPTGVRAGVAAGMTVFGYSECMPADRLKQAGATLTFSNMFALPTLIA